MATPEESSVAEAEAKKEWERKNEEFKVEVIDKIKEELIKKFREEWKDDFKDSVFYAGNDAEENNDDWEYFLISEKFGQEFKKMKSEYLSTNDIEVYRYSAWQVCGGFGSTPSFEISPKFDLDGEESIVKFFKEKLEELKSQDKE
jgi:hypothetical protein